MGTRTALAALLAPVFLVTACDGGTPIADPPVSPPPTSSPAPPPPKRESPEHFIRRWAVEDTRIQQTGRTATFLSMSQGCTACRKLARLVERIYRGGGYIDTKGWKIRRILPGGSTSFDMFVDVSETTYRESRDGAVQHLPAGPARFRVRLAPKGSTWSVAAFVQVAS